MSVDSVEPTTGPGFLKELLSVALKGEAGGERCQTIKEKRDLLLDCVSCLC